MVQLCYVVSVGDGLVLVLDLSVFEGFLFFVVFFLVFWMWCGFLGEMCFVLDTILFGVVHVISGSL